MNKKLQMVGVLFVKEQELVLLRHSHFNNITL